MQEISRDRKTRLRFDQFFIVTQAMKRGDDRGKLGGHANGFAKVGGGVVALKVRIEAAEGTGGGAKGVHRFRGAGRDLRTASVCSGSAALAESSDLSRESSERLGSLDSQRR